MNHVAGRFARTHSCGRLLGCAAFGTVLVLGSQDVLAQAQASQSVTTDSEVTEVIVTGSRIRGIEAVGSNVVALGRDEITASTGNSVMEVLNSTPQLLNYGVNQQTLTSTSGNSNVQRSSSINLHGINQAATLVLFNGRRGPPMGTNGAFVDPSYVPTIALERVEVVADGASAIYGADAVAGVVNFITRRNFTGLEVRGRYGGADDYETGQAGFIVGHDWGSGHAMFAAEHAQNSALSGNDRDFVRSDLTALGGRDYRGSGCTPGNIVVGGVPYAIPEGGVTPATASLLQPGTRNRCETYRDFDFIPKLERTGLNFFAEQDLGERFSVFAEGFYSKRHWTQRHTTSGSSNLVANLSVPSSNAFFVAPPGTNPASVTVEYDFSRDFGGLYTGHGFEKTFGGTGGAKVDLWGDWQAEVTATWGQDQTFFNAERIDVEALAIALRSSDPATALNPFQPGTSNPAVIAAIDNYRFEPEGKNRFSVYEARFDGSLFDLPAGPVRMAFGVSRMDTNLWSETRRGILGQSLTGPLTSADRDVESVYAEVFAPLVSAANAVPFVRRLELSLAGRIDRYSDVGDTENPKFGLNWSPLEGLLVRASYGTSFRAPNLSDVTVTRPGNGITFGIYADPASPTGSSPGFNLSTGNPNLTPETATTRSLSFEWRPLALPELSMTAAYWDIEFENQVATLVSSTTVLQDPNVAHRVIRNPSQELVDSYLNSGLPLNGVRPPMISVIIDARPYNESATNAAGVDFDLGYRWLTDSIGQLSVGVMGTYFLEYETKLTPTTPFASRLDDLNNPVRLRTRARAAWQGDDLGAALFVNYVGSYDNTTVAPIEKVDAYTTVDMHVGYELEALGNSWLAGAEVALDVSNLFDEDPPFVNIQGGYDPVQASLIGRQWIVSFTQRF